MLAGMFARVLALTLSVVAVANSRAATAPYQDNFDGYAPGATPSGFVTAANYSIFGDSSWGVAASGNNGAYASTLRAHGGNSSSAISLTNLAQVSFQLSTTFVPGTPFTNQSNVQGGGAGVGALGNTADFSVSGYRASFTTLSQNLPGTPLPFLGSLVLSGSGMETGTGFVTIPVVYGATYTMTLTGVYMTTGLLLTATVSDGINTISATVLDATPATGTYFGYYDWVQGSVQRTVRVSANYDNFSVSVVPEPATTALLVLGGGVIAVRAGRSGLRLRRSRR